MPKALQGGVFGASKMIQFLRRIDQTTNEWNHVGSRTLYEVIRPRYLQLGKYFLIYMRSHRPPAYQSEFDEINIMTDTILKREKKNIQNLSYGHLSLILENYTKLYIKYTSLLKKYFNLFDTEKLKNYYLEAEKYAEEMYEEQTVQQKNHDKLLRTDEEYRLAYYIQLFGLEEALEMIETERLQANEDNEPRNSGYSFRGQDTHKGPGPPLPKWHGY